MGLVDSGDLGTWQIIKPSAATNLVANPSFETDTTGWATTTATFTRTAGAGAFGAYGGRLLASATNGRATYTSSDIASGTVAVASVWVRADTPSAAYLHFEIGATVVALGHPGDGEWHRLEITITAPSTAPALLKVLDNRASAWTNIDVDGAQLETGASVATTYIDGDQDGCQWTGAPHASTSTRDGRDARGGSIVSLASLGWTEKTWGGIGAPEMTAITQPHAISDGEIYQHQTVKPRVITLSALAQAVDLEALHADRRALMDAIAPDARANRGQIRLRYTGSGTPKLIDVVNETGFGFEKPYHQRAEMAELRFLAPDPIWLGETEESAALTTNQTLSPVSAMAMRSAGGTWSTLGGGVTANSLAQIHVVQELPNKTVVIAGENIANFGAVAAADNLAVWDGSAFAVLGTAAPDGDVFSSAIGLTGDLYISGAFTTVGGVTVTRIAKWDGATWAILGTGGLTVAGFLTLAVDPVTGYLWGAGSGIIPYPALAGGVTINGLGMWNGSAWVAISQTGLPAATWMATGPQALVFGPDGRLYLAVVSSTTKGIYVWDGSSWSLFAESTGTSNGVYALLNARGRLYAAGYFTGLGGITVSNIAEISGAGISSMAGGVVTSTAFGVRSLAATSDGLVHAGGRDWTSAGGITSIDSIASWNGSSWQPFAANPPDTGTHVNDWYNVKHTRSGQVVVGWTALSGTFGTTMLAEVSTTVTNDGSANAYPIIQLGGPGTVYTIANLTTGQRINFNGCTLVSGETAILDLRPGRKTFGAQLRNLLSTILPGSDLSTFCLAPGSNTIAMMMSAGTAALRFVTRDVSVD